MWSVWLVFCDCGFHSVCPLMEAFGSFICSRWWSRRTCAHLLLQELWNRNLLLNNHWQDNVGSHQKTIPHVQGQRRSPNKMVGRVKSHIESNFISARDAGGLKQSLVHTRTQRPHRNWVRPAFECLSVSCRDVGQQWPATGIGPLAAADLAGMVCDISPLGGGCL